MASKHPLFLRLLGVSQPQERNRLYGCQLSQIILFHRARLGKGRINLVAFDELVYLQTISKLWSTLTTHFPLCLPVSSGNNSLLRISVLLRRSSRVFSTDTDEIPYKIYLLKSSSSTISLSVFFTFSLVIKICFSSVSGTS